MGEKEKENIVCVFFKPFSKQAVEHVQSRIKETSDINSFFFR